MKKTIETLIRKRLMAIKKNCDFKKAWIPTGWTAVNINKFSKEMAEEIVKEFKNVDFL